MHNEVINQHIITSCSSTEYWVGHPGNTVLDSLQMSSLAFGEESVTTKTHSIFMRTKINALKILLKPKIVLKPYI